MLRLRPRPLPSLPRRGIRIRGRSILLIDPDPASRDIGSLLMRYFGYEVQTAATFHEGMHLARTARPAAVVSELVPDAAGEGTIVEALKNNPATARIPVLVLSSHVLPADQERAVAAGAASFLTKPCDGQHLRDVLAEVVGVPQRVSRGSDGAAAAVSGRNG